MLKVVSNIFIAFGLVLLLFVGYKVWEENNPARLSFDSFYPLSVPQEFNLESIEIPSISINLPIFPSKIENGRWESTKKGVSYLLTSPTPGEVGNSILYGHDFPNLLGNLPKIKPGDEIFVRYKNANPKKFIVEYTQVVSPKDSSVLNQTQDSRITLYTCTGFLDSKRFIAVALFKTIE
ncbi:hypothetical protein A2627_02300 [Candidatus Woesebacteria bacterium RIFCSPHIGHO2_01_FULL_39_28]|uniref:Sortase n=1 Tax=Candidatus Woesebacteria bacterium RIFCSPHIGHO2_01_FULL_39_28 TaxID=1802496 RepID=A0A1F7YF10_9BACT|nr:MAG: hypothetical protein A2627_02300 [Candidatus Woesebacteria bacterium RIFCSPHIGHO2_01_FULL_39_28]